MNDSLEALEDLEIYLKTNNLEAILQWLAQQFDSTRIDKRSGQGLMLTADYQSKSVPIVITLNAGGCGFTSLWFKSKNTPWRDDLALARAAYKHFNVPVRCIESAWQQGDDPDQWFEISAEGEGIIHWPN